MSQRALDWLHQDNPSEKAPGVGSLDAEKKHYQQDLGTYAFALQELDSITLNSKFQSYANTINDPSASDSAKLQAYSNYRVESALADTTFSSWKSSDQDFKFDHVTKDSAFIHFIDSGDVSSYYKQQAVLRSQDPHGTIDFAKNSANLIDAGASLTSIQQDVIAINIFS